VTEFWNTAERRWQMADPQIDDVQRKAMRLTVDTTDPAPGSFLTGWQLLDALRSGRLANLDRVGFPPANAGLTYGRNKLFADFVSMTGQEIPVHAWWGTGEPASAESGYDALLNRMTSLLQGINQNDPAAPDEALQLAETHLRLRRPDGYVIPPWALEPSWGLNIQRVAKDCGARRPLPD
jgi:hypothetical protein